MNRSGFVQVKALSDLKEGDIIRHVSATLGYESLIVTANHGAHVTAVRTQDITNPPEWQVWRVIQPVQE
jgi:hypothetical protein